MSKQEAVRQFLACKYISGTTYAKVQAWLDDEPAQAEEWNDYTDALCKAGEITPHQYQTWTHPNWKRELAR